MKQMTLYSPAFKDRGQIPQKYTCDGEDINPPFIFENIPEDAQSLAFVVDDPDSPGKTWLHWALYNIAPHVEGISEDSVPIGAIECVSDFGNVGYGGPCPATGIHRYNFQLFALDKVLELTEDIARDELLDAIQPHVIEKANLTGLYSRE